MAFLDMNVIAIEGPDRTGKHTHAMMLVRELNCLKKRTSCIEIPFDDHVTYPIIYRMLKNGNAKRCPNLFQFVQFLNKFFFQATYFLWLALTHDCIVLDRWKLSSLVYGTVTGANGTFIRFLNYLLVDPDLTIVLRGMSYLLHGDDVYETDAKLQNNVAKGYYDWVLAHLADHAFAYNIGSKDVVAHRVINIVKAFLDNTVLNLAKDRQWQSLA